MGSFGRSSAVEQLTVNQRVAGSNPAARAKEDNTNSNFEDERVRSPSLANGGAGLRSARATPSLWREMKRILMLSGESIFSFLKTNNINL